MLEDLNPNILLKPRLLPDPLQLEPSIRSNSDRSSFCSSNSFLHCLVELLGIEHQHVHGLLILLGVHVDPHHGCLDCGQNSKLCSQSWDLFTDLKEFFLVQFLEIMFLLTCKRFVLIFLSVQCLASSLARSVILSEASARALAQAISSLLVPFPPLISSDRCAIK